VLLPLGLNYDQLCKNYGVTSIEELAGAVIVAQVHLSHEESKILRAFPGELLFLKNHTETLPAFIAPVVPSEAVPA
jgi:hypothetical protein